MTSNASDVSTSAGIIRLGNAFCDAKALLTAVELDVFSALHDAPATETEIRDRLALHGRGLSDFLDLLVALGLLIAEDGTYRNAEGADEYLVRGRASYVGGFLRRTDRSRYPLWGKLAGALRTGSPQSEMDFKSLLDDPVLVDQFVQMMDSLTQVISKELLDAFDWGRYGSILDVGGCRGNVAGNIVKRYPALAGAVFDMPQLEPFFEEHVAYLGLTGRIRFHGGNFFADPLPDSDVVVMGHVLHNWNREQRRSLVEKAYAAVNPGGALVVYDRMLDDDSSKHIENLVISLDMLLVSEGGSGYRTEELRGHAETAGFTSFTARPLGDYDTLVVCHKGEEEPRSKIGSA
ncbi:methyltransferase [Amycolatopsis sp. lyj-90]|uniref:methyltransferase n=1 Tax=Amycolatopsis sp. lyj-90 TaxID=2789285 RepID=UPI00397DDB24